MDVKRMRLRYTGTCSICETPIGKGEWALYDRGA